MIYHPTQYCSVCVSSYYWTGSSRANHVLEKLELQKTPRPTPLVGGKIPPFSENRKWELCSTRMCLEAVQQCNVNNNESIILWLYTVFIMYGLFAPYS